MKSLHFFDLPSFSPTIPRSYRPPWPRHQALHRGAVVRLPRDPAGHAASGPKPPGRLCDARIARGRLETSKRAESCHAGMSISKWGWKWGTPQNGSLKYWQKMEQIYGKKGWCTHDFCWFWIYGGASKIGIDGIERQADITWIHMYWKFTGIMFKVFDHRIDSGCERVKRLAHGNVYHVYGWAITHVWNHPPNHLMSQTQCHLHHPQVVAISVGAVPKKIHPPLDTCLWRWLSMGFPHLFRWFAPHLQMMLPAIDLHSWKFLDMGVLYPPNHLFSWEFPVETIHFSPIDGKPPLFFVVIKVYKKSYFPQ